MSESRLDKRLREFAEEVTLRAKDELVRAGKSVSGTLASSLTYDKGETTRRKKVVLFGHDKDANYWKFVHFGVSGTEVKREGTPFKYTTKQPPSEPIAEWIQAKGIKLRNSRGRFIKMSKKNIGGVAFVIARSIKRKGIEGVFHYDKAIEQTLKGYEGRFIESTIQDIQDRVIPSIKIK